MTERQFIFSSKEIEALQPGDKILVEVEIQRVVPRQTKVVVVADNNTGIAAELSFAYDEIKAIPARTTIKFGDYVSRRDELDRTGWMAPIGKVVGETETQLWVEFVHDKPVRGKRSEFVFRRSEE